MTATTEVVSKRSNADTMEPPVMLDVQSVARLLSCSPRHIYRLVDAGKMPRPVKLGSLIRWHRSNVENWLTSGCLPVRTSTGRR